MEIRCPLPYPGSSGHSVVLLEWTTHADSPLCLGSSVASPGSMATKSVLVKLLKKQPFRHILNPYALWDICLVLTQCFISFLLFSGTRDFSILHLSVALNLNFIGNISSIMSIRSFSLKFFTQVSFLY